MRINIVIDQKLMEETLRATGLKTRREAVELGLRTVLRLRQQEQIRHFRGKLDWEGDLDRMRNDSGIAIGPGRAMKTRATLATKKNG